MAHLCKLFKLAWGKSAASALRAWDRLSPGTPASRRPALSTLAPLPAELSAPQKKAETRGSFGKLPPGTKVTRDDKPA